MTRRVLLGSGVATVVSVCLAVTPIEAADRRAAAIDKPNIIFILTDDQRWDVMSCMGHPFVKTPNMDRLANEGVLFKNAFVTTSLCSPSRASFLTGTYAHRHGVIGNWGCELDHDTMPSFPRVLRDAGYETGYVGKWHMGKHADPPRPQGLDAGASAQECRSVSRAFPPQA